jgi:hypothetical protein
LAAQRAALPARAEFAELWPEAVSARAAAQSFPVPGAALSAALQAVSVEPAPLARPVVGAAWVVEALPQEGAAAASDAEAEPPQEGAAEASDAEAGPQQGVAARAVAVPRPAEVPQAALPSERPQVADLLAAAWVCRRDQALPLPGPRPAAQFAHAMASSQIAWL